MRYGEYRGHRIRYERSDHWEAVVYTPTGRLVGRRLTATLVEGEAELLRRVAMVIDEKIERTSAQRFA